jgi:hypothetical protein
MSVKITKKENQAKGVFAGGAILENKPIGFPQDGGSQKSYSNLFYWANATTDVGGLIDEHPHKMFEIMSFVLEGEIEHYDSQLKDWLTLRAGDVQIIRSRGGISHAERLLKNSRIFQIWFDPNIRESMLKEATYDDYKSETLFSVVENGISSKNYVGNGGPIKMDAEGVEIKELSLVSTNQMQLDISMIYSFYVLDGTLEVNGEIAKSDDFIIVEDEAEINIKTDGVKLFSIATVKKLSYKTYKELVKY